jgi:mono/diheme cytochrome c family protein
MRLVLALMAAFPSIAPAQAQQFEKGAQLYTEYCALCHGADGRGGQGFGTPIWGAQTQINKFVTAKGLFEYVQLIMPFDDPNKLNNEQKWAVLNYMLVNHGSLKKGDQLDSSTADTVKIP